MRRNAKNTVLVCGAGAAGMAAALAAARCGAHVCLVESKPRPGGTVAHSFIHTLGGLFDSAGEYLQVGLARELADALVKADPAVGKRRLGRTYVLNVSPETYQTVVQHWLESEPRIAPLYESRVTRIVKSGRRIGAVYTSGPCGETRLAVGAVIDATGSAEFVRLADADLVEDDEHAAAGGLIFRLRGVVAGTLAFPKGVAVLRALRAGVEAGTLPLECSKAWLDSGAFADEVYVKLFVPRVVRGNRELAMKAAMAARAAVFTFLKGLPGFEKSWIARTGELGVRDGGRIRGEYLLTVDDVRRGRAFPDGVCRCSWPIEYWDPCTGVSLEYLPDGSSYEIPLRALKVAGLENVWAAGKILSADRFAQASARVVGCCWAMGEAAGKAAAVLRMRDEPVPAFS